MEKRPKDRLRDPALASALEEFEAEDARTAACVRGLADEVDPLAAFLPEPAAAQPTDPSAPHRVSATDGLQSPATEFCTSPWYERVRWSAAVLAIAVPAAFAAVLPTLRPSAPVELPGTTVDSSALAAYGFVEYRRPLNHGPVEFATKSGEKLESEAPQELMAKPGALREQRSAVVRAQQSGSLERLADGDGMGSSDSVVRPRLAANVVTEPAFTAPLVSQVENSSSAVAVERASVSSVSATIDDWAAIGSVLAGYRTAFNVLNSDAARAVWPSVDTKALSRAFDRLEAQNLEFENCTISVEGARASAACQGSARYTPRVGQRTAYTEPRQWTFNLRKLGADWLIDEVDAR